MASASTTSFNGVPEEKSQKSRSAMNVDTALELRDLL